LQLSRRVCASPRGAHSEQAREPLRARSSIKGNREARAAYSIEALFEKFFYLDARGADHTERVAILLFRVDRSNRQSLFSGAHHLLQK
jgi:hypothetical protein